MVQQRRREIEQNIDKVLEAESNDKKKKVQHIFSILNQEKIDLELLREACVTQYGLVNDEVRKKVWPLLLNVEQLHQDLDETMDTTHSPHSQNGNPKAKPKSSNHNNGSSASNKLSEEIEWKKYIKGHKDTPQIEKDINRSLNSFDKCKQMTKYQKALLREQLSNIIHGILVKNNDLYYYQGFHDFVSVFMLTLGENMGFYCAEASSRYLIRDYMLETFETGVIPALNLILKLLQQIDVDLYEMILLAGSQPTFTLSWILTWFSHDLFSFCQVQRIYDACLSQHPLFTLYLAVATIKYNKSKVEDSDEDPLTAVYMVFQRLEPQTYNFDVDSVISNALKYINLVPPNRLLELQDSNLYFKFDSPFLRYEMEKYYLRNNKLQNVLDPQKKKQIKLNSLFSTIKQFGIVIFGVGIVVATMAINIQQQQH